MTARTLASPSLPGIANAGPRRSRTAGRSPAHTVRHCLTGPVAWVDADQGLVVLRVERASRRGRRFVGATVTVDLSQARLSAPDRDGDGRLTVGDLLPGERLSIDVTLPARTERLPDSLAARRATCESFS